MEDFDFNLVWEAHPNIKWLVFNNKCVRGYPGDIYIAIDGSFRFAARYFVDLDPMFLPMNTEEEHKELIDWLNSCDYEDVIFGNPNNPGDWVSEKEHEQRMKDTYGNSNIGSRFD